MKRKRHTGSQIIAKLRQAEAERAGGATIEAVCKRLEISTQTYMRWRERYAGMDDLDPGRVSSTPELAGVGLS